MKEYKCICGKEFDNGRSLQSHERTCKEYKRQRDKNRQEDLLKKEAKRLPNGMFKCENPKCGKEHDGSYGSGRFCSDSCRRSYSAQQNNFVELGKQRRSRRQMNIHEQHLKARAPYGTWKCEQCNLIFETRAQLFDHNHDVHPIPKGSSWNKGLTKETDERVARNAEHVSESLRKTIADGYVSPTWDGTYWTEEKRKEQSERKKKLYKEHPEKHPNRKLANNRAKMNYPEQVTYDWLIQNNIQFEHQKEFILDNKKRFVDFYIPSINLFIEIDGEYWHPIGNEADKTKDEIAIKHGYKILRIRPKNGVIDQLKQYFFGGLIK